MAQKKQQSVLDQVLGNIGKTASNVFSTAQKTISPTIQNIADNFVKGYQHQVQQNQVQAKQNQQQIADFTNNFLKTTQKVATPVVNYFNPLKAKPDYVSTVLSKPTNNFFTAPTTYAKTAWDVATGPEGQQIFKIGKDAFNTQRISSSIPSGQLTSLPALYKLATNPQGAASDMRNTLKSVQQSSPRLISLNKNTGQLEPNILENQKAIIKAVGLAQGPLKIAIGGAIMIPFKGVENMIDKKAPWAQDYHKSMAEGMDFTTLLGPVSAFAGGVLSPFLKFIKPDYLPTVTEMILTRNEAVDPAIKAAANWRIAEVFTRNILEAATKGFAGMGAVGAMEPADTIQQRFYNLITMGLQGAVFEGGFKTLGLGAERILNRKAGIIPDISTPPTGVPPPPINPVGPSNQANLTQPQTPADIIQADMQKTLNQPAPEFKTIPSGPDNHNINIDDAKKIIDNIFTPEEIQFKTNGEKNIVTPDGKLADGLYYKSLITVVEQGGKVDNKTVYHEAFHAYADKFVNPDLYGAALYDVMSREGISKQAASEKLADSFADYASGKQTFTGQVLAFFQDFINKFRTLIGKNNSAQQIYDSILNKDRPNSGGVSSDISQFKVGGKGEITPSDKWQEYNPDQAMPIGGEFKTENGKQYVRFPKDIAKQNENVIQQDQGQPQPVPAVASEVPPLPGAPITNPQGTKIFEKKPGQINVNKFANLTDEQKQHILDKTATGDYESLSNDEIIALAEFSGVDMKHLNIKQLALKVSRKLNVRRAINELEQQVDKMKKDKAPKTEIIKKELQIAKMGEIAKGHAREAGVTLSAQKILADEFNTPRQRVYALLEQAGVKPEDFTKLAADIDFNNPDQVLEMYRSLVPAKWYNWIDKLRYADMLSSPNTNMINLASNTQGTGIIAPISLTLQGTIDKAINILSMGKHQRARFAGEGIEYAKGYYGAQLRSLQYAFKTFWQPIWDSTQTSIDVRFIPLTKKGTAGRVVENAVDFPGRFLAAEDRYARTATQEGYRRALQYRQDKGVKVNNVDDLALKKAKKSIFTSPTYVSGEGILSEAIGVVANKIQSLTLDNVPILARIPAKWSFPFMRIGSNLFKAMEEYSPLGFINMIHNTDKIEQASHAIMGTAVAYGAFKLGMAGMLQGAYDRDPDKAAEQKAAGVLPYSLKVMGPDGKFHYIQFSKMFPMFSGNLTVMAAVFQAWEEGKLDEDKAAVIMDTLAKAVLAINDQTYWKTAADFTSVMGGDPFAWKGLLINYPSQLIPFRAFQSWLTRGIDEFQRAPDPDADMITGLIQRMQAGIPGLSTDVPTKKGPYGEDIKWPERWINLISPNKVSTVNPSDLKVYEEMKKRYNLNILLNKESKEEDKLKKNLIPLTPAELRVKKEKDVSNDVLRKEIQLGKQTSAINGNTYIYWDDNVQTTKTVDLNSFLTKKTGIEGIKQQENAHETARYIHDAPLSQYLTEADKDRAYKTLGTNREEVRYDSIANLTENEKTAYLIDKFTNQPKEFILERLVTGRVNSVSGKQFATDAVLGNLVDEGIITDAERDALKAIKYNRSGQLLKSGSGKKVNYSFSNVKMGTPTYTKFKLLGPPATGTTTQLARIKRINTKAPNMGSYNGKGFKANKISAKLRAPARTLSGLGRIS